MIREDAPRHTTTRHDDPQEKEPSKPSGNPDPDALLSVGEAAMELGIYPARVARAMVRGDLPFQRLGGNGWRFTKRDDLLEWGASLKKPAKRRTGAR